MEPDARIEAVVTPAAASTPRRSRLGWLRLPFRRPPNAPPAPDDSEMTLTGHLVELRNRLFIAAVSLVIFSIGIHFSLGRMLRPLRLASSAAAGRGRRWGWQR